jgi:hypothetical protein
MEKSTIKPLSDGVAHDIAFEATKIIFSAYNKEHDFGNETPESVAMALAEMYCKARAALPSVFDADDQRNP